MKRQQIEEWLENPVTLEVKALVEKEIEDIESGRGADSYVPFEPNKTQELLAGINGGLVAWYELLETLEGKGLLEEEDDGD